jgi:hypothetical protein
MTCMIAPSAELFDTMVHSIVPRRRFEAEPLYMPAHLFDFPPEPPRRRKFDVHLSPEEDLERWDGLS